MKCNVCMHACMYVCVCVYVCMCMYVYLCVCICMWMYVNVCVCMCMCMYVYVYVDMHVCTNIYIWIYIYIYGYIIYIYIRICIYINMYRERERYKEREREGSPILMCAMSKHGKTFALGYGYPWLSHLWESLHLSVSNTNHLLAWTIFHNLNIFKWRMWLSKNKQIRLFAGCIVCLRWLKETWRKPWKYWHNR